MDKTAMVSIDVSRGAEILAALERGKLKVNVALWMYLSEYEEWRMVIASRDLDTADPREAYRLLFDALAKGGMRAFEDPAILILPTKDPFIRDLRKVFGKSASVEGMRLGGQTIGNRFVEGAYAYKIAR